MDDVKFSMLARTASLCAAAALVSSCAAFRLGDNTAASILGDDDPELVESALPTLIKTAEVLSDTWPADPGYAGAAASLELLYASSFIADRAVALPDEAFEEREALTARAKAMYRRAFERASGPLERRTPGFFDGVARGDVKALETTGKRDLDLLYYSGAAILGAFSVDPFDAGTSKLLGAALACLERVRAVEPGWNLGAAEELLMSAALALPDAGREAKATALRDAALAASDGSRASVHVAWAIGYCVPNGDPAGYKAALALALAVDPNARPDQRLLNVLARRRAERLLRDIDRYFLDPDAESAE